MMNTAEMWLKAQKDGRSYIAGDKTYSLKNGFQYLGKKMSEKTTNYNFDSFMNISNWIEDPNVMTKEEAEEKFHIRII